MNDRRFPRGLFRATLALAPALAAVFLTAAHAADDPDAKTVAAVQKAGGKVERDDKAPGKPIINVNLGVSAANDETLAALTGLKSIKRLTLNNTKVTDAGLAHLSGLASLEKLYLVDTKVTDAGLAHLKGLANLQVLSVAGTQVTDAGLAPLKGLKNLREVYVFGTKVGDAGVKTLKEALPKAKVEK